MILTNPPIFLVLLVILLACSAFFSGSETALMAISRLRLRQLSETKPIRAGLVERLLKRPERLIGVILLGNNLVNVAMSALATAFAISLWGQKGIVYVTGILTALILIFAEITPKVYAKYFNERVSLMTAPVLNGIMVLLNPFVILITYITNNLLLLIGVDVRKMKKPLLTEEEIRTVIKMGWDEGAITAEERKILSRVFTLNDRRVEEVMIPREKMTVIDINASVDEITRNIIDTGYTRFPVKEGLASNVVGFIHAKDMFGILDQKDRGTIRRIMRPPYFVTHDTMIDVQLRSFQARKLHQAVVRDKAGTIVGLVTLEDIVEELVGTIQDEHDY